MLSLKTTETSQTFLTALLNIPCKALNSYASVKLKLTISNNVVITLRRDDADDWFTASGWTPEGRRARGRTKNTWRKTLEKERNMTGRKSKVAAQKQTVLG